jgi:hypothetical protein
MMAGFCAQAVALARMHVTSSVVRIPIRPVVEVAERERVRRRRSNKVPPEVKARFERAHVTD